MHLNKVIRNIPNKKALCSWSGGKDSCFALLKATHQSFIPTVLLNVMNENGKISRSHGIGKEILEAQSASMQVPISFVSSSWADYETNFISQLRTLKEKYGINYTIFGDIDIETHRQWEEKVSNACQLEAVLPLWKQDRKKLVHEMIDSGIKAMIVSCNATLGEEFLGRIIDEKTIKDLERKNVDVCGENGEYHTLVLNCPLFKEEIQVAIANKRKHEQYWFCELELIS